MQLRCKWGSHPPINLGASADPQIENPPQEHFLPEDGRLGWKEKGEETRKLPSKFLVAAS